MTYDVTKWRTFPLKDYAKTPAVSAWNNDDNYSLKDDQLTYAVDTGRSNLLVVDCDNNGDEENGVESFTRLCMEQGGEIPNTLTVQTPNDGLHFYFKTTPEQVYSNSVGKVLGPNIDIRATGGYIVGPGSKVKDKSGDIKEYVILDEEVPVAFIPEWLVESLNTHENNKKAKNTTKSKTNQTNNGTSGDKNTYSEKEEYEQRIALNWAITQMSQAKIGERENFLNRLAYFMGCKRVPHDEAVKLIEEAVRTGLTLKEAQNKFDHGYNDGLKEDLQEFDIITKEFKVAAGLSFKDDPLDAEYYTNFSLAYNFWKALKNKFIYYIDDKKWYTYNDDKNVWAEISEELMKSHLKEYLEEMVDNIRKNNDKLPPNIYKLQEKIFSRNNLENVIAVAKLDFKNTEHNLFDSQPYLINCKNGVYNLETGKLEPHDKDLYLTKIIPFDYIPDLTDKYCDKVIESIAPSERDYMKIISGQSLVAEQPITQKGFFLHGGGSNGKSTFIDLLLRTSGDYGMLQAPDVLLPNNGKEVYALSNFEGLRTAIIEELPDSKQLNVGSLKRLVGSSTINSRQIYKSNKTFDNNITLFVTCNRLPVISESNYGSWRRLAVITFPYSYKNKKDDVKGNNDKLADPMVIFNAQKSRKTAEAFLSWRIAGAQQWFRNKNIERNIPESVENTVQSWNENSDPLLSFFNDEVELCPNHFILMRDFLEAYNKTLLSKGQSTMSMRTAVEEIKNHPFMADHMGRVTYKARAVINKSMIHSPLMAPDNYSSKINTPTGQVSYLLGLKFKDKNSNGEGDD